VIAESHVSLAIRRPTADEAAELAALHIACWQEAYRGIVPDEVLAGADLTRRTAVWQGAIANHERIVLAAFDGRNPVGFVMAGAALETLFAGMDGHIPALYVAASHYRRGIGRRLMGEAARAWQAQGGRSLALGVLAANARARAFYEACGARLVSDGVYDWDGHELAHAVYCFDDLARLKSEAAPQSLPPDRGPTGSA
jgi:ribosomal protein S18 acetylase RimI-like enzyme